MGSPRSTVMGGLSAPGNKVTATGTAIKAELQVLGGPDSSITLNPNDLKWNRRPWGQGTRAENRAKAKRQSKAKWY